MFVSSRSPTPVPSPIPPAATSKQTYLQFWFSSASTSSVWINRVRAATTVTPAPYGITVSWPEIEHLATSNRHGSYDTRMDPLITTPTIPTILTQNIRFGKPFDTPPKVIVWLTGLSAATGAAVCVKAVANDITETEFQLHISSDGGSRLGSVGVAWAVWPEAGISDHLGLQKVANVGSVCAVAPGGGRVPVFSKTGSVRGKVVMVAVSAVDLVLAGGVWVEVVFTGQSWRMSAGPVDASMYSARVAYVSY